MITMQPFEPPTEIDDIEAKRRRVPTVFDELFLTPTGTLIALGVAITVVAALAAWFAE